MKLWILCIMLQNTFKYVPSTPSVSKGWRTQPPEVFLKWHMSKTRDESCGPSLDSFYGVNILLVIQGTNDYLILKLQLSTGRTFSTSPGFGWIWSDSNPVMRDDAHDLRPPGKSSVVGYAPYSPSQEGFHPGVQISSDALCWKLLEKSLVWQFIVGLGKI